MKITLEWLVENFACESGVAWWTSQKETDSIKVLRKLAKLKQESWFNWLASRLMTHAQKVEWAIFCAKQVLPIYETKYPDKHAPRKAVEAAEAWLKDPSEKNRNAANAAYVAANAAYAAANAAYAAANAADAAANAADAAANAAYAAANAADAARQKMITICQKEAIRILKAL